MVRKIRYIIFLRDVLFLSVGAFGGPQAHLALYLDRLVRKRGYLTEEELIELNALCQVLPGPTSTQTLTAVGYKIGGPNLAYLTLLMWVLPAFILMTTFGLMISYFSETGISTDFTKFIQPMAVGFVAYAAFIISFKVIKTYEASAIMIISAILSYMVKSPYLLPFLLLAGGAITAIKYKAHPREEKKKLKINWSNFLLWLGVLLSLALLGHVTQFKAIKLFENFYRNGSLIFGGGQVLIPLLYTEFVEFKEYLSSEEFLTGYAAVQSVPGPVFSFTSYIGALSMREYGIGGEILGGFLATVGIFLPGTFFIFFVYGFWEQLKKYRIVKASLEGINAASSGMVASATFLLFEPIEPAFINLFFLIGTFCLLMFTKIPSPLIILTGLLLGLVI